MRRAESGASSSWTGQAMMRQGLRGTGSTGSLTGILQAEAGEVIEISFAHLGAIRFGIVA